MKTLIKDSLIAFVAVFALVFALPQFAQALNTPAGTGISNVATVDYDVGGSTIKIFSCYSGACTNAVASDDPTVFNVDRKVDFTVKKHSVTIESYIRLS